MPAQAQRGFILQPSYRVESGRAVVHLWGRLENGCTFLVRDDRLIPHFYIRVADREKALGLGARRLVSSRRTTLTDEPVLRVEVPLPRDTPALRETLEHQGIRTFEADVRFAMRYLIDRGIRSSLSIIGSGRRARGVDQAFENPEIEPADWTPTLKVLSLDIETDPRTQGILSVALFGCGAGEVLLLSRASDEVPDKSIPVSSERDLLVALCQRVRELDPDILTGWNVADFDFTVLLRKAQQLGLRLQMGRGEEATRLRRRRSAGTAAEVLIPGRVVLDAPQLLRSSFVRMERHSLDFVARQVLGEGKLLGGPDKAGAILRAFGTDRKKFVEYNLTDARLVLEILQALQLIELVTQRSLLTGLPVDRVASSLAAFDLLYLSELGRRGRVAPSVRRQHQAGEPTSGGYVFEPRPGLFENVLVFDFKSLYPSIIRTFQIDPLGFVERPKRGEDVIITASGAAFRREPGILTLLLDALLPRREAAKRTGNRVESQAIKILMNSFFGVLGTPMCRFYNPAIANAITTSGRHLLMWCRDRLEGWGYRVLYGDTDSLFVNSGCVEADAALVLAEDLRARLNRELARYISNKWHLESRLEIDFERLYLRLFLPSVRHGTAGARKRYAGLVQGSSGPEVVLTGLEAVRRDWTDLAREAQFELYRRLFLEEPVEAYLRRLVEELQGGLLDEKLTYRRALRKSVEAYVSTTPPHVAAARKLTGPPGRSISFVMTTAGPEPVGQRKNPIDYRHYLERQLRPVAEPVLQQLDLDFDKLIGEDRQMDLFS